MNGERPVETLVNLLAQRLPLQYAGLLAPALVIGIVVAALKLRRERLGRWVDRKTGAGGMIFTMMYGADGRERRVQGAQHPPAALRRSNGARRRRESLRFFMKTYCNDNNPDNKTGFVSPAGNAP
ncbi:hypothetical protein [Roseiflexus castenholzii]|uniref:hypothetical protein n=1 Tax=Roseiflexus castenholzii TaxID=120962 RepID=UPI003C7CDB63